MPLGTDYAQQNCAIARALEVVGERWTLLVVRDLFYGVRRYSDLRRHIGLPPATLTDRLAHLIEQGVARRVAGPGARDEYELTAKGADLWPVIHGLSRWGNEHYVEPDNRMLMTHRDCGTLLDGCGACRRCGLTPAAPDVLVQRQSTDPAGSADPIAAALLEPHRLLEPLRA